MEKQTLIDAYLEGTKDTSQNTGERMHWAEQYAKRILKTGLEQQKTAAELLENSSHMNWLTPSQKILVEAMMETYKGMKTEDTGLNKLVTWMENEKKEELTARSIYTKAVVLEMEE